MKKKLLILTMCLFTTLSANAVSWIDLESGVPDLQVSIDADSVKYIKYDTCTYAIRMQKANEVERVVYLKSNYSTNTAGIARIEDYKPENYKPAFYSKHSAAFMKSVDAESFIGLSHNYALSLYPEKGAPLYKSQLSPTNLKYVSCIVKNGNLGLSEADFNEYSRAIKAQIFENWKPPLEAQNSKITMVLNIGKDGSLKGYKIVKSDALDVAKRAAMSAIELSAPFEKFPNNATSDVEDLNLQVEFIYNFVRKYVK